MTLDGLDLMNATTPATNNGGSTRKCRRHRWAFVVDRASDRYGTDICLSCDAVRDPDAARRGRTNRSRGNSIERWVCKLLGISRRGMYGGPDDGGDSDDWITVQVKSGGTYPERIDALLRALPDRAGQLRGVVHADTPGPGTKRRALITLDLYDFAAWYGGKGETK